MLSAFGPGIRDAIEAFEGLGATVATAFEFGQEGTSRSVFDFMQNLPTEDFVAVNDAFQEMGGTRSSRCVRTTSI